MAIDKELLHVKAYYCARFAGVGPVMPYLSMICYHKGLSLVTVGLIWGILSFTGLVWRSVGGAMADYFKNYRGLFMMSLTTVAIGYFGIFITPDIPGAEVEVQSVSALVQMPSWSYRLGFPDLDIREDLEEDSPDFGEIKVDRFNVSRVEQDLVLSFQPLSRFPKHLKNKDFGESDNVTFLPPARLVLTCFGDCLQKDSKCDPMEFNLKTSDFTKVTTSSSAFFVTAKSANASEEEEEEKLHRLGEEVFECQLSQTPRDPSSDQVVANRSKRPELKAEIEVEVESVYSAMGHLVMQYQFWVMFGFLLLIYFGLTVGLTMADTICFGVLGPERRHQFGKQRMWGMVGRGSMAFLAGALVDWYSGSSQTKNYLPSFALGIGFTLLTVAIVAKLKVNIGSKKLQMTEVGRTLWKPQALLYLFNAFTMGINIGVTFTFNLILIEKMANEWDSNFQFVKLLQGVALAVSCFGGEVPLLFMSGTFLKRLGVDVMYLVLMIMQSSRCGLVYFVRDPWFLLPIELLSGATFGLFNACNAFSANKIAPAGGEATIQGVFGSCLFGGWSIGGVIGGILFNSVGGRRTYFYLGCFTIIYTSIYASAQCLLTRSVDKGSKSDVEAECMAPDQEPSLPPKLVRRPSVYSSTTSI